MITKDIINFLEQKKYDYLEEYNELLAQGSADMRDIEFLRGKIDCILEVIFDLEEEFDVELYYEKELDDV